MHSEFRAAKGNAEKDTDSDTEKDTDTEQKRETETETLLIVLNLLCLGFHLKCAAERAFLWGTSN